MAVADEALGIGVRGDRGRGRGRAEHAGVLDRVHLITGTFDRAFGGPTGGLAAGQSTIIEWLRQKAPPYMLPAAVPLRWRQSRWRRRCTMPSTSSRP